MNKVSVIFPNGTKKLVSYGKTVGDILNEGSWQQDKYPLVGVLVNNELTSLSYRIEVNSHLLPVTLSSDAGIQIYRRTLSFLLAFAVEALYPQARLIIAHSLGNGYFYFVEKENDLTELEMRSIEDKMHEIVSKDIPIQRLVISYNDALEYFKNKGQEDTALLLEYRNENKIPVYTCESFIDLSHGPLAPTTGIVKSFKLKLYKSGFLLRFPSADDPLKLKSFKENQFLFEIYQEHKNWGKTLNITSVGKLNQITERGEARNFIRIAEALQEKKIASIAEDIAKKIDTVKSILIAGPSSSGKTTFTKKLAVHLMTFGFSPSSISIDDYFVPREFTPLDEDGNYDFEALEAIDITLLNDHVLSLIDGKEVEIPNFDFRTGERKYPGKVVRLREGGILLLEGIHGLNNELTPKIPSENKYKIYISALTGLNLDDHNRIPTTDNRLIRRLVRDNLFRGRSALSTLKQWPSVRRGEDKYIFPFQNGADSAFNSALDYELGVLKLYAEPLLKAVKPYQEEYAEALRLLSFLNNFLPILAKFVPQDSILREFIGDSGFKY